MLARLLSAVVAVAESLCTNARDRGIRVSSFWDAPPAGREFWLRSAVIRLQHVEP